MEQVNIQTAGLSMAPTILTDIFGSFLIIILSFLSLNYSYLLTRHQPDNLLWGFLFYLCLVMAAFSISRAVGHIVKQFLLMTDHKAVWKVLSPYSGGFNTMMIVSVSAVMIYYHKGVEAFRILEATAEKLRVANLQRANAAEEMMRMNLHLEDMVEERTAELSKSEKKFRHLFSNSRDMVYFCDEGQVMADINKSGLEMLGYDEMSQTHLEPLNLDQIFNSDDELNVYLETLYEQGFIKDMEVEFKKADGSVINVLLSAAAIYDDNNRMIGCEGIVKDLTGVKNMMQQMAGSEKMASIGQMAAGVAHEINTPLGIILGYSQLMMDDFKKDEENYQNLEVIERQTKTCRKIVADLLKFSRQSESSKQNISLNKVAGDVLAITEHTLNLDRIEIEMHFEDNLPTIVGDVEKIRQVFLNLINNAHHAMENGGTLSVFTRFDNNKKQISITFQDTGEGIPKEIQDRVFDPFFTTKSVGKGTGLGMSVSYGIVQDHGGTITIKSPVNEHQQQPGTAIIVSLPTDNEIPAVTDYMKKVQESKDVGNGGVNG